MGVAESYQNFKVFSKICLGFVFALFVFHMLIVIYKGYKKAFGDPDAAKEFEVTVSFI